MKMIDNCVASTTPRHDEDEDDDEDHDGDD
jgi:hypothetical protein